MLEADKKNIAKMVSQDLESNRLTLITNLDGRDKHGYSIGKFSCICGETVVKALTLVKSNKVKSCGCLGKDSNMMKIIKARDVAHAASRVKNRTHGMTGTPLYFIWRGVLNRCTNPTVKSYKTYGARGITISDEWKDFQCFYDDMHASYSIHRNLHDNDTTLERVDNAKGYCRENCRWATRSEQMKNTSLTRNVTIDGETQHLEDWCHHFGISSSAVYRRVRKGMSFAEALCIPANRGHLLTIDGETLNIREWSDRMGLNETTIFDRLNYGWSEYEAVMTPIGGPRVKPGNGDEG